MNSSAASLIKQEALRLGFSSCGICLPDFSGEQAIYLQQWLDNGFQGEMEYMNRNLEKRNDPRLLFPNVRSIVIAALNYYPLKKQHPDAAQIAYYAYGKDYHTVIKEKLHQLLDYIHENIHPVKGKIVCDTAPFLEKYHAVKAGLGWIGKNTQLIIPGKGSFFFLGAILLDIPLEQDAFQEKNKCGNCTGCIDACPTKALLKPGLLDANRCLSYLTIEYKGILPEFYADAIGNRIYGCDTCNKVCPWNQDIIGTDEKEFQPSESILNLTFHAIEEMDEAAFNHLFGQSSIHRIGLNQLKRNIKHRNRS